MSDSQAATRASVSEPSGGDPKTRGERKVRQGVVVSDKMDKTVVVQIDRRTIHPRYRKTITRSEKLHAHDETNDVRVGDRVQIAETRPLSKQKRWRVVEVIDRAK